MEEGAGGSGPGRRGIEKVSGLGSLAPVWLVSAVLLLAGCSAGSDRLAAYRAPPEPPRIAGAPLRDPPPLPERIKLVGMPGPHVEQVFGPPSLRRREPPAEYWRYSFTRCTLDLFLYEDERQGLPRVVYYELHATWPTPQASFEGCADFGVGFELLEQAGRRRLPDVAEH